MEHGARGGLLLALGQGGADPGQLFILCSMNQVLVYAECCRRRSRWCCNSMSQVTWQFQVTVLQVPQVPQLDRVSEWQSRGARCKGHDAAFPKQNIVKGRMSHTVVVNKLTKYAPTFFPRPLRRPGRKWCSRLNQDDVFRDVGSPAKQCESCFALPCKTR